MSIPTAPEPETEAGRALLRDNFVITEHTDPRQRVADDLTAPQFVAAILAIEHQAAERAVADHAFAENGHAYCARCAASKEDE
jgi:hypothetical protein